ncbi:hypothetical protein H9P43_006232 [Blastocladiella emersonii ATCC 22665]|nr:hypothetical protein H9P43_006232 [Blastocladiella emersonii ATCC 22665]
MTSSPPPPTAAIEEAWFSAVAAGRLDEVKALLVSGGPGLLGAQRHDETKYDPDFADIAEALLGTDTRGMTGVQVALFNLDSQEGSESGTSSSMAAADSQTRRELIMYLVEASSVDQLRLRWGENNTTLHVASFLGEIDVIQAILDRGVPHHLQNNLAFAPIDVAPDDLTRDVFRKFTTSLPKSPQRRIALNMQASSSSLDEDESSDEPSPAPLRRAASSHAKSASDASGPAALRAGSVDSISIQSTPAVATLAAAAESKSSLVATSSSSLNAPVVDTPVVFTGKYLKPREELEIDDLPKISLRRRDTVPAASAKSAASAAATGAAAPPSRRRIVGVSLDIFDEVLGGDAKDGDESAPDWAGMKTSSLVTRNPFRKLEADASKPKPAPATTGKKWMPPAPKEAPPPPPKPKWEVNVKIGPTRSVPDEVKAPVVTATVPEVLKPLASASASPVKMTASPASKSPVASPTKTSHGRSDSVTNSPTHSRSESMTKSPTHSRSDSITKTPLGHARSDSITKRAFAKSPEPPTTTTTSTPAESVPEWARRPADNAEGLVRPSKLKSAESSCSLGGRASSTLGSHPSCSSLRSHDDSPGSRGEPAIDRAPTDFSRIRANFARMTAENPDLPKNPNEKLADLFAVAANNGKPVPVLRARAPAVRKKEVETASMVVGSAVPAPAPVVVDQAKVEEEEEHVEEQHHDQDSGHDASGSARPSSKPQAVKADSGVECQGVPSLWNEAAAVEAQAAEAEVVDPEPEPVAAEEIQAEPEAPQPQPQEPETDDHEHDHVASSSTELLPPLPSLDLGLGGLDFGDLEASLGLGELLDNGFLTDRPASPVNVRPRSPPARPTAASPAKPHAEPVSMIDMDHTMASVSSIPHAEDMDMDEDASLHSMAVLPAHVPMPAHGSASEIVVEADTGFGGAPIPRIKRRSTGGAASPVPGDLPTPAPSAAASSSAGEVEAWPSRGLAMTRTASVATNATSASFARPSSPRGKKTVTFEPAWSAADAGPVTAATVGALASSTATQQQVQQAQAAAAAAAPPSPARARATSVSESGTLLFKVGQIAGLDWVLSERQMSHAMVCVQRNGITAPVFTSRPYLVLSDKVTIHDEAAIAVAPADQLVIEVRLRVERRQPAKTGLFGGRIFGKREEPVKDIKEETLARHIVDVPQLLRAAAGQVYAESVSLPAQRAPIAITLAAMFLPAMTPPGPWRTLADAQQGVAHVKQAVSAVVRDGYLFQRGGDSPFWRRRHIAVIGWRLVPQDNPAAAIDLGQCVGIARGDDTLEGRAYVIALKFRGDERVLFAAESETAAAEWCSLLERRIEAWPGDSLVRMALEAAAEGAQA